VAKEILETEKFYVTSLTTCIKVRFVSSYVLLLSSFLNLTQLSLFLKVFMVPLEEMVTKHPKSALASNDDIRVIFCNIVPILNFHVTLLSMMEPRVVGWTARQCLGDIFLQLVSLPPFVLLYLSISICEWNADSERLLGCVSEGVHNLSTKLQRFQPTATRSHEKREVHKVP
jgi:hypothetical protein